MSPFVTRFAPSPTGYLHIGHALSALTAWRAADEANGKCLLRIEDLDETRCKPEFEQAVFNDLHWLGLEWDTPVRRQSEHLEEYFDVLERLAADGLVYRCFRTRKEITQEIARAPHLGLDGPEGPQFFGSPLPRPEERALLADGAPFAWRLSIAAAREKLGPRFHELSFREETIASPHEPKVQKATPEIFGDVVLGRKDCGASYHLASVYDDALQGVTHIIRGEDLAAAAHLHGLLQALLGFPTPVYRHHHLMTDKDGKKFSKRDKAATIRAMRENGAAPDDLKQLLMI